MCPDWKSNQKPFSYGIVLQPVRARQVHSGFWEMEENVRSCGNETHAFVQGWAVHAHCNPHVAKWEALTLNEHKAGRV